MERRPLGRTGLTVPILGFGGAPLGNEYGPVDDSAAARALHHAIDHGIDFIDVAVKNGAGNLIESAVPHVSIVKDGNYTAESFTSVPEREVDTLAQIEDNLRHNPLAGFVIEGQSPYGSMTNKAREQLLAQVITPRLVRRAKPGRRKACRAEDSSQPCRRVLPGKG